MVKKLIIPKGEEYLIAALDELKHPFFKKGDGLPHGIIDKRYTGIGATTLQLTSNTNTILVLPFVRLAEEKANNPDFNAHYCKAGYGFEKNIQKYIESDIEPKRLIIVADNLHKLPEVLGEDIYDKYQVVIDECEILQTQSGFRNVLPRCIDEFLKYSKKTLVSATPIYFTDTNLDSLPKIEVQRENEAKKNLILIKAVDPCHFVSKKIITSTNNNKNEKFLIGCNSTKGIKNIIEYLSTSGFDKVKVLASDYTLKKLKPKYSGELKNFKLPAQVTICTSAYNSGLDIKDKFHLVGVSLDEEIHQSFSVESFVQFEGRERTDSIISRALVVKSPFDHSCFESIPTKEQLNEKFKSLNNVVDSVNKIEGSLDRKAIAEAIVKAELDIDGLYYLKEGSLLASNHLIYDLLKHEKGKDLAFKDDYRELEIKLASRFTITKKIRDKEIGPYLNLSKSLTLNEYLTHITELIPSQPHTLYSIARANNYDSKLRGICLSFFIGFHEYGINGRMIIQFLKNLIKEYNDNHANVSFLRFIEIIGLAFSLNKTGKLKSILSKLQGLKKPLSAKDIWLVFSEVIETNELSFGTNSSPKYNEVLCLFKIAFTHEIKSKKYIVKGGFFPFFHKYEVINHRLEKDRDLKPTVYFGTRFISRFIGEVEEGILMDKLGLDVIIELSKS